MSDPTPTRAVPRPWVRVVVFPLAILVLYFVVPVDADRAPMGVLGGVLLSIGALGSVTAIVFTEVRGAQHRLSGRQLVLVLEVVLVVFSFVYYLISQQHPDQFVGLSTRLDALYFATTTTATVGFGDVSASGQTARGIVTLHMVFNLVFIGAVVNLARERMSERRAEAVLSATQPEAPESSKPEA